jgi:pilus assembly protein CpaD
MRRIHIGEGGPLQRTILGLCLAFALAGCYRTPVAENYPADYRERHPITLSDGERTVKVFLGRNRGGLTASQRADVLAFAHAWRHDATSGILVEVPQSGPSARAGADSLREVHAIFAASGVPREAVAVRSYRPLPAALASIKLSYSRLTAHAGPCGLWPKDLGPAYDSGDMQNRPYWNLGCATQRNLAAMVSNPADLVQPRGEAPADSARRSTAFTNYRTGKSPAGTYDGYDKGKISDLGK